MNGEHLERRVAHLLNREGSFVRRRVDITRWLDERVQITDIDVLQYDYAADLSLTRTCIECKSGAAKSAPKEVDRLFWLHGVRSLVAADGALLVTDKQPSNRVRSVAGSLHIHVLGVDDIARRERGLGTEEPIAWGAHNPAQLGNEARAYNPNKEDRELQRAAQFLRSDFWHLDPTLSLKRVVALVERLSKRLVDGLQEAEANALRWLLIDAGVCFVVSITQLASMAIALPSEDFRRVFAELLSEGLAPVSQLKRISDEVDKYIAAVFEQAGIARHITVEAMGAFHPTPPAYTAPLIETIERFAEKPFAARHAPLVMDLLTGTRLKSGTVVTPDLRAFQVIDPDATIALIRIALAFLTGNCGMPAFILEPFGRKPMEQRDAVLNAGHASERETASHPLALDFREAAVKDVADAVIARPMRRARK